MAETQGGTEPAKPRQKLVVVSEYCTHARGSSCERCAWCCPKGAIQLESGAAPTVDHTLCNGCGICFGVCDAFASTRMTMPDLHARVQRIALGGQRVYLTCRENVFPGLNVDTNVLVLPCLSMLSPEFGTLMLAENIRVSLACDLKYCDGCDRGGELGGELFGRAIEIAEERTGERVLFSSRIPERQGLLEKYGESSDVLGRRAAFTELATDVGEIASGKRRLRNSEVLADYYQKKEQARAAARLKLPDGNPLDSFTPMGRTKRTTFPKLRMVLQAVESRPDIAGNIGVAVSATDAAGCTLSGECVKSCPTGARSLNTRGKSVKVDVRLCVGCGICATVCEQGACSIVQETARIYLPPEGGG